MGRSPSYKGLYVRRLATRVCTLEGMKVWGGHLATRVCTLEG